MILPLVTIALTFAFLVLTIALTRRSHIPALKSSLLAPLLSLDGGLKRDLGGMRPPAAMEEQARNLSVRLEYNGREWLIARRD